MYIEKVNTPKDVKQIPLADLPILASEMRRILLEKLSAHGGHVGPNLGMVEATIALHYVFDSPTDKLVFDVSHQSYAHKMLTGRREAFMNQEDYDEVSGYSNPRESEHDCFTIGHTSTSVSLACGLAKGRDLRNERYNVVAVIGDGSLSGGEAYEGLSNAAEQGTNFIIVVNDNEMSIAENHGGLYGNLRELRESKGQAACNFFRALGLDYVYVEDGNDVAQLVEAFRQVKDAPRPVVVHIRTEKGRGYQPAEQNKERFHYSMPFDLPTGQLKKLSAGGESYSDLTGRFLLEEMKKDPRLVAITAGTPAVMGFTPDRRRAAGRQFVDVGIAEEHAVAFASGIAAGGGRPVFGVFSTFLQRAYDQLSQDLCINGNPAVIPVFGGSLHAMNDETHLGFFDIPLVSNVPGMVYLAPTNCEEYFAMLRWAIRQKEHPVAVRVPGVAVEHTAEAVDEDYSELNRYRMTRQGAGIAVLALGSFYGLGREVVEELARRGVCATLVNPRYVTGVDADMLESLKKDHRVVVTLEDGVLDGGFGEKIARFYAASSMRVLNYGLRKEFCDRFDAAELMRENRLTRTLVAEDAERLLAQLE